MPSAAQIAANRENAKRSTGPKTEQGRAISARNNTRHGLSHGFLILASEDPEDFQKLLNRLETEHHIQTETERQLVLKMAQHYWSSQRAMLLQGELLYDGIETPEQEKRFALYLRYQTTHDRAYSKCLNDLLKLQKERRNQAIGFESQKAKQARESERAASRQAAEERKKELHQYAVAIAQSKLALADKRKNADQTAQKAFDDLLKRAFPQ